MDFHSNPEMTWEQFREMLKLMLDYHSLTKPDQQAILLMIDGLKYRSEKSETGSRPAAKEKE